MSTNRLFNMIVAAVLVIVVALVIQQAFATKAIAPETHNIYSQSKEDALRDYQLGERYGVMPQQYYRNKFLDECSDVGLIYRAECLSQSQESTP
jgi:hypothetical protein